MKIALVDYGAGNLTSVRKGFAAVGVELFTPGSPDNLSEAAGVVVPGVGHFGATAALEGAWRNAIERCVGHGTPLLGICLGMQWLFEGSEEAPGVRGLGALGGMCARIAPGDPGTPVPLKVPHVGWNVIAKRRPARLLEQVPDGTWFYYTHSYAAPDTPATVAVTPHGVEFPAVVETGRVFGMQFHPEKSGPAGLRTLEAFAGLCRAR